MSAAPTTETKPTPPLVETLTVKVDGKAVTALKLLPGRPGRLTKV